MRGLCRSSEQNKAWPKLYLRSKRKVAIAFVDEPYLATLETSR